MFASAKFSHIIDKILRITTTVATYAVPAFLVVLGLLDDAKNK